MQSTEPSAWLLVSVLWRCTVLMVFYLSCDVGLSRAWLPCFLVPCT